MSSSNCRVEQSIEHQAEKMDHLVRGYISRLPQEEKEVCIIEVMLVNCDGEENGYCEKCKGECEKSNTRSAQIVLKKNIRRSSFQEKRIVIDEKSRLGQKFLSAKEGEIVLFEGGFFPGKKNSARIIEKR